MPYFITGDFHFLWECLRVIVRTYWGNNSQTGSIGNLRQVVNRKKVDKGVKVFSVGDEFLMHSFSAHLTASICEVFGISSPDQPIPHESSREWLNSTAKALVSRTVAPVETTDPFFAYHRSFLRTCFLYADLRSAIR